MALGLVEELDRYADCGRHLVGMCGTNWSVVGGMCCCRDAFGDAAQWLLELEVWVEPRWVGS